MDAETPTFQDPRLRAYCDASGPEVFHAVAHRQDIWREDPFDVEHIHGEARETYRRLVDRASTSEHREAGRILLLKGEAGAGKTHLMRAFRSHLHGQGAGYFGYMQMSTMTDNYGRYMLRNLLDSLDKPYWNSSGPLTGLMRLSNALIEGPQFQRLAERYAKGGDIVPKLREGGLDADRLNRFVRRIAELLVEEPSLEKVDIDVLSALLYLQPGNPVLKNYALKFLNAQGLSPAQQSRLGGMAPRTGEEDPMDLLEQLARVMWGTHGNIIVLCLDQLEDIYNMDQAKDRFRRAMSAVTSFIDKVPSSIVVVSCLGEFYTELRGVLARPIRDRLEHAPEPIQLEETRSAREVRDMAALRLRHYYEAFDLSVDEADPFFPYTPDDLDSLASLRTRDVLDHCRVHRERAVQRQGLPEPAFEETPSPQPPPAQVQALQQAWNDHLRNLELETPDEDAEQAALLARALELSGEELDPTPTVRTAHRGTCIDAAYGSMRMWIRICNKSAKGGALARQIREAAERAGKRQFVLVRSTDWPSNPRTQICRYLGELVARGARRAVIEASDWRVMTAYPAFAERHGQDPGFADWRRVDRPLTSLPALRAILDLPERTLTRVKPEGPLKRPLQAEPAGRPAEPPSAEPKGRGEPVTKTFGPLTVGRQEGLASGAVALKPEELTRHAAFLGGTGSGKSTVAMVLVEQLLLSGVPALVIDRKGDLCSYADPDGRRSPAPTDTAEDRRKALLERTDVRLYTPGDPRGRGLSMTLVPEDVSDLPSVERERIIGYAATALCQMMGYNLSTARPKSLHAILKCALGVLSQLVPADEVTLEGLVKMLDERDPSLLSAVGKLDVKLFDKLVNDLETLRLGKGRLLASGAERLSMEALLGQGVHHRPGRTRLSIISTKFLGDEQDVLFWVARLLVELGRWTSRHPQQSLQAVVLFDEADLYLPAARKPATKEPMEHLLKRARSAGLGMLLASQNPGDFDYRCRDNIHTWFLGLIKEEPSLRKMRPMLKELREDVTARLPGQSVGQFHLVRGGRVARLRADRSAVELRQLPEERILSLAKEGRR